MSSELLVVNSFVRLIQGFGNVLHRFKCPHPLNRGVHLIKVTFVWLIWDLIRDFGNCPLNTGCPFNEDFLIEV